MNKMLLLLAISAQIGFASEPHFHLGTYKVKAKADLTGKKIKADGETKKVIKLVSKLSKATLVDIEIKDETGTVKESVRKRLDPNTKDVITLDPQNTAHIKATTAQGPLSMDFTSGEFNIKKELAKIAAKEEKEKEKEKKSKKRSSELRQSYKEKKSVAFADLPKKK